MVCECVWFQIPDVLDCLKQISVIMEHSVVNLSEHIRQQGRLEMILSRVGGYLTII